MARYDEIADRKRELKDAKIDLILSSQKMLDAQANIERSIAGLNEASQEMVDVSTALARVAGVLKLVTGVIGLFAV